MNKQICNLTWNKTRYITNLCELEIEKNKRKLSREDKDYHNRMLQFLTKLTNQVNSHYHEKVDPVEYLFELYKTWNECVHNKLEELWVNINTNLLKKYYETFWWKKEVEISDKEKENNKIIKQKVEDILRWFKISEGTNHMKSNELDTPWNTLINRLFNYSLIEEENIKALASFINSLNEEGFNLKIVTKIINIVIKTTKPGTTFHISYDELKEIMIEYEKIRKNLPFNSWVQKIDKILDAIINWKVHVQESGNIKEENILETVNQIKLQILWIIEIDWNEEELKELIREYIKHKSDKNELRKIWIKIIRLLHRVQSIYNKKKWKFKKVELPDNISESINQYYKTEENWNLAEALILEKLLKLSKYDKEVEVVITPDVLDHKKVDFILKIKWKDNSLVIWTQITLTRGKLTDFKKTEVENLAYEIDNPKLVNNHENKNYNLINLWDLSPKLRPDITAFISIEASLWKKLYWKRWKKLKHAIIQSFNEDKIWYLDESLDLNESEKLKIISLWYVLASKEINSFLEKWFYNKKVRIPNTWYNLNLTNFEKDNSSVNVNISNDKWHILARVNFFITQSSLNKYWNNKKIKWRNLKAKRNSKNTWYLWKQKK